MEDIRATITNNFFTQNAIAEDQFRPDSDVLDDSVLRERISFTNKELVEMFPEAKKTIASLIKQDEQTLAESRTLREKVYNNLYPKVKMDNLDIAVSLVMCVVDNQIVEHKNKNSEFMIGELISDRLERNRKLLAVYKIMGKKNKTNEDLFELKKERAKAFPIENLVQVNRMGWAKCPFHTEKDPSFKINKKKNLWFCFGGCGGGDSISLVMKLNNYSFKEAVEKLS